VEVYQSIGPNTCIRMLRNLLQPSIDDRYQISAPSKVPGTVAVPPEPLVLPGVTRGIRQEFHELFKLTSSVLLTLLLLLFRERRTGSFSAIVAQVRYYTRRSETAVATAILADDALHP
jgi:hypothetical protein